MCSRGTTAVPAATPPHGSHWCTCSITLVWPGSTGALLAPPRLTVTHAGFVITNRSASPLAVTTAIASGTVESPLFQPLSVLPCLSRGRVAPLSPPHLTVCLRWRQLCSSGGSRCGCQPGKERVLPSGLNGVGSPRRDVSSLCFV